MRFVSFKDARGKGLAIKTATGEYRGLTDNDKDYPGDLLHLLRAGPSALRDASQVLSRGAALAPEQMQFLPPLVQASKIICIGLNYRDHSLESGFKPPSYPAVFVRFNSTLVGHLASIVLPKLSEQLDYEGEVAAVIGKGGRHIPRSAALQHVAGYSLFNDASIRDYQFKSTQWTVGKNFDSTGAFGPEFISADELPPGCKGLRFKTRLNDMVVQTGALDDLIFDVESLVSLLSDAMTLEPGDIIVTGTPGGVGFARKPPLWMKAGDICTITSTELGVLKNPIVGER